MDLSQLLLIGTNEHAHLTGEEIDTCPRSQSILAQVVGSPNLLSLLAVFGNRVPLKVLNQKECIMNECCAPEICVLSQSVGRVGVDRGWDCGDGLGGYDPGLKPHLEPWP